MMRRRVLSDRRHAMTFEINPMPSKFSRRVNSFRFLTGSTVW